MPARVVFNKLYQKKWDGEIQNKFSEQSKLKNKKRVDTRICRREWTNWKNLKRLETHHIELELYQKKMKRGDPKQNFQTNQKRRWGNSRIYRRDKQNAKNRIDHKPTKSDFHRGKGTIGAPKCIYPWGKKIYFTLIASKSLEFQISWNPSNRTSTGKKER